MAQLNQVEHVEPIEEKDIIKENKQSLLVLTGFTVYMLASTFLFDSSNKY